MLTRQDLYFLLTVLSQGMDARTLVEACREGAGESDIDLPGILLRRNVLDRHQVDIGLQALQACLERNGWHEDAALEELMRLVGPARLEACWDAVFGPAGRVEHSNNARQRYADSQLHGEGGLGRVWRARDGRTGRIVALKELRPELAAHTPALGRFVQEAQITAQLDHPNIIPVYELHDHSGCEAPFYTMKFISGGTLQDALDQYHRQPPAEGWASLEFRSILIAFTKVCEAVAFAHSRSIIHRDLKPANMAFGEFGAVLVIDWGLARRIDDAEILLVEGPVDDRLDRTRAGQVVGTPAFMAPEQAAGALDRLGPATDVYGLGATLFAILTGKPPHLGQTGESIPDYLSRIAAAKTPNVLASRPDAPPGLAAICARAMAEAPAGRYASAADLAAEIHRWLAGLAVHAYRERWPLRLGRWLKKHPIWTQAAASISLMLVVAASVLVTNSWANERTMALLSRANLDQEARSLAEIYQSRLDDFPERVRFRSQLPLLSAALQDGADRSLQQRVEDFIRAAMQLRPEYLEVGVIRRKPRTWLIQANRDQPGAANLQMMTDRPVDSPPVLKFLIASEQSGEPSHCRVVPPDRVGASATLWMGVKVFGAKDDQDAGILLVVADLQKLIQTPESTGLGGGYVHIVNSAGTILTRPIAGEARPAVGRIEDHNPALASYFATRPLAESGVFPGEDGVAQLTACRRLVVHCGPSPEELVLVVERPLDVEAAESERGHRIVMGLTALVIVAALALTYGLVRLLARGPGPASASGTAAPSA